MAIVGAIGGRLVAGALYQVVRPGASLGWWEDTPDGRCWRRRTLARGEFIRYAGQEWGDGVSVFCDVFTASSGERGRFSPCFYGLAQREYLRGPHG